MPLSGFWGSVIHSEMRHYFTSPAVVLILAGALLSAVLGYTSTDTNDRALFLPTMPIKRPFLPLTPNDGLLFVLFLNTGTMLLSYYFNLLSSLRNCLCPLILGHFLLLLASLFPQSLKDPKLALCFVRSGDSCPRQGEQMLICLFFSRAV